MGGGRMNQFYSICIGLSIGVFLGFLGSALKHLFGRKSFTESQISAARNFINKAAKVLKYITFFVLAQGLIWCIYFLVLGIVSPGQADYADNMAELIVSVLTVISIIFAFVEFLRRKED